MERQSKLSWKFGLAVVSGCLNVVFLTAFISVFFAVPDTAACPEGLVEHDSRSLMFCELDPRSEAALVTPNQVSLTLDGQVIVDLEYTDDNSSMLQRMSIWGPNSKPWIDIEIEDRSMIYNLYADRADQDPSVSLRDKDGDGIPDVKIDWTTNTGYKRIGELQWKALEKGERVP